MTLTKITPGQLAQWCDTLLNAKQFKDYSPNGLQVDADVGITKIITAVTATQNVIDYAIAKEADAILVHHGYFWKGESQPITGMKGKRIRTLLQNNISLLAYHLPLDAHPDIGNNAVLAKQLGLSITGGLYPDEKYPVGNVAHCEPQSIDEIIANVTKALGRPPLHIAANRISESDNPSQDGYITKIGLCTGGAQDMIEQAALMGCQLYISGEISERTTHMARELGIDYLAAGHHATEVGGIKELGKLVHEKLDIEVEFHNDPNPA